MIFIKLPTGISSTVSSTLYTKLQMLSTLAATLLNKQFTDEKYEGKSCNMKYVHKCNAMSMMWKMIAYDINMYNGSYYFKDIVAKYDVLKLTECFNKQLSLPNNRELISIGGHRGGVVSLFSLDTNYIIQNSTGGLYVGKDINDCLLEIID